MIVIRKFKGFAYVKGLSLLVAVFLLFLFIQPGKEDGPLFMRRTFPQEQQKGAAANAFQFAFLSDLHKGWGVFKPIMKEIARDENSFAVIGGDIVAQNKGDRYRFVLRELTEVKGPPPLYFVTGNHDVYDYADNPEYSLENFRRYCGPDDYWFFWGNAAFIVLNDARLTITNDQFHWLQDTLRMARGRFAHIFVFMHIPPFDPREGQSYCLPKSDGEKFMALMEKFGVTYVFCGHIHCYFREVINGVIYIIAGGAGGGLKCPDSFYHYVRVSVQGEVIEDSVIKVQKDWRLEITGDIKYELRVRKPFLLSFLTVAMGQSFLYFFAL